MSGHAFRFAPLLEWAEQREDQQAVVLAAAVRSEEEASATLEMLLAERERQIALIEGGPADSISGANRIDPEARQAAVVYLEYLERCIAAQQDAVAEAHARAEAERATLVEISQEKRSLEHLRERDEARAFDEAERREANTINDLNMSRHARALGALDGKE